MTSPNLRSTMAALDVARPLIVRLDERRHPEDAAADLIEGWAAVETALRAMIGGSSLGGQALVSEVRAQGLLDYPHAHALLGFLAARDRATRPDYQPTAEDVAAARAGFQAIEAANGSGIAADTGVHRSVTPPGACCRRPRRRRAASRAGAGDRARPAARAAAGRIVAGSATARRVDRAGRRDHGAGARRGARRAATCRRGPPPPPRRGGCRCLGGLALLLLALGAGATCCWTAARARRAPRRRIAPTARPRDGRAAAFERAATEQPGSSMARVYLGRLAREDGDIPRATAYLDTAIRLDTTNAVAFREMGQLQLYANRPQLAVSFFRRAIERDPTTAWRRGGWRAPSPGGQRRRGRALLHARRHRRVDGLPPERSLAPGAPGGVRAAAAAGPACRGAGRRQPLTP
jgi:hypothetical protein